MSPDQQHGIVFPHSADGRRSTADVGRAVVADALRGVDPVGALNASQETNWRSGYLLHFRRLVEAGLSSRDAALTIARDGLDSLHDRMRVVGPNGTDLPLGEWPTDGRELGTVEVQGESEPETELSLPFHGRRLRGDDLRHRLDDWVAAGVMEPSAAEAVREVMGNPEWLRLD
ncbi:MAG TPA: hypothetical protein VFY11_09460, partial [Nocardioidaceae bacterium]|nr:hypothetical protein [Nocardioidaceae bacterium]